MGDMSVNGVSFEGNKLKTQNDDNGDAVDNSVGGFNDVKSVFQDPLANSATSGVAKQQNVTAQQPVNSSQNVKEPAFKTDIAAFEKMNVAEGATPQKVVNGINIYATGSKEKIEVLNINGNTRITIGSSGQKIDIPAGEMQAKGSSVVYNGKTLAVKGLTNATITGVKDDEAHKQYLGNQMLAKDCNNCTFDMNDKANGWSDSRDALVMDNCKSAKVISGQNNAFVATNGTTADVSYNSTGGKAAQAEPLKDWINKFHTYYASDESSSVTCSKNGTVNRDSHNPLIQDMVSSDGIGGKEIFYQQIDGTKVSASAFLLDVINKDAKSPSNVSHSGSVDSSGFGASSFKLSTKELIQQVEQIQGNRKK